MPQPRPVVVADAAALAAELAARFVAEARAAIAARGRFDVALAGGSTPKAAYARLAALRDGAPDWGAVRFFFGDERCVPPDDERSNYRSAHDALLEPLGIAPARVFRMAGEREPEDAARAYAATLRAELPLHDGRPVFDLVLLGMGPDGHTASLFPGDDPFADDAALVKATATYAGTRRVTLTPRVIDAARAIVVAAGGREKAAALAAVLAGPRDPARYPAQVVAPESGTLVWLVDREAASQLGR